LNLSEVRRSLRLLRKRSRQAEEELKSAQQALAESERSRAATEKALNARLIARYKFRASGGVPALMSARDFQGAARVQRNLERVLAADARLFQEHREAEVRYAADVVRTRELRDELKVGAREIGAREDRTRRQLVERTNLVSLLRSRSDQEKRAVEDLREAARRLERTLEDLPADRSDGPGLTRGSVVLPVEGSIRGGFGLQRDPQYGTSIRRNGVEFAAAVGTPVHAVAPGRVLFAGWFKGYGQMVIIDHGSGSLTVSGYLDELLVDVEGRVSGGDLIGTVGQTGTLSEPGLYFEIRKDGKAVDPERWIRSIQ
jgi:septal ring factor EnvC (AmiA/AmiB activator)